MEAIKAFIKEMGVGAMYCYHNGQLYFCPKHWKYIKDWPIARLGKFTLPKRFVSPRGKFIYISNSQQLNSLCK